MLDQNEKEDVMAGRPGLTYEDFCKAAESILAEKRPVNSRTLPEKCGGASMTTILNHLRRWRESQQKPAPKFTMSARLGLAHSEEVEEYARAVAAHAQQECADVQEQLDEVLTELPKLEERLEAAATEASRRLAAERELERRLADAERRHEQALRELAEASVKVAQLNELPGQLSRAQTETQLANQLVAELKANSLLRERELNAERERTEALQAEARSLIRKLGDAEAGLRLQTQALDAANAKLASMESLREVLHSMGLKRPSDGSTD